MQNNSVSRAHYSIVFWFAGLTALILFFKYLFPLSGVNYNVLIAGNLLLFSVGLLSFRMSLNALRHKSVQVFLRLVYGSFLMKFFILAAGAVLYIFINRKNINKPALFGCFALYIIYTFIEVRAVLKLSKKPDA